MVVARTLNYEQSRDLKKLNLTIDRARQLAADSRLAENVVQGLIQTESSASTLDDDDGSIGPTSTSGYTRGTVISHIHTSYLNFEGTALKLFLRGIIERNELNKHVK